MAREKYRIPPTDDIQTLVIHLNNILSKITIQLQRIEGLDGYTTVMKGPVAHSGSTFGFFSKTPAAQQSAITDLSATPSDAEIQTAVNSLISVLETLGLIADA